MERTGASTRGRRRFSVTSTSDSRSPDHLGRRAGYTFSPNIRRVDLFIIRPVRADTESLWGASRNCYLTEDLEEIALVVTQPGAEARDRGAGAGVRAHASAVVSTPLQAPPAAEKGWRKSRG